MKLIFILTLGVCLTASATGYSQKITLSERSASLKSLFQEIEKQTNYYFLYGMSGLMR